MSSAVEIWCRKLLFLFLFSLSGLILNHPTWRFAGFWEKRVQESYDLRITPPAGGENLSLVRNIIAQLNIRGEVSGKIVKPESGLLEFRVVRPGHIYEIKADSNNGSAKINHIHVNAWGVLNMLHSFTGVRRSDPDQHQNWWATWIWRFSMDAMSASLAFMIFSGIYLRYRRTRRLLGGALALALGTLVLSCFLVF
jgi:hypothetical protein